MRKSSNIRPKELNLTLTPNSEKATKQCPKKKKLDKKTVKEQQLMSKFKNIDFTKQNSTGSFTTQILEFPNANIARTDMGKRDECGELKVAKAKGYDMDSTSNSHFRDAVQSIKLRKRSCTTISSDISEGRQTDSCITIRPPNSQEMIDSQHKHSGRRLNLLPEGEWKAPCPASLDIESQPSHIGACPPNYRKLAKMTKARQKFFLTQDPRRTHCLVNPDTLRRKQETRKKEFEKATKIIRHAENICAGSDTEESESYICEVIDLENPLGLDFQGLDYKYTYEQDEQEMQNQKTYWRLKRFMERKRVKKETKDNVEAELQAERLAIPPMFATTIKDKPPVSTSKVETPRLVKLYRTHNKPSNKQRIDDEKERRVTRYKDIYLRNKEREKQREIERKAKEAAEADIKARTVAENDFREVVNQIDEAIDRSFKKVEEVKQVKVKRRMFPKTLRQTDRFKKKMNLENCERRDAARITEQFFLERTGKQKNYPAARLDINCEGSIAGEQKSSTEASSDDEDKLQVGKDGDDFMLRGFHFKLGEGLRGKFHRHQIMQGKRAIKGCLTREQWLNELAPRKEVVKLDVETGIVRVQHPDDPNLVLFPPKVLYKQRLTPMKSAVREYIKKRLGLHYHRMLRKNLKLSKPSLKYTVRKFNLIRFVFPDITKFDQDETVVQDIIKDGTTLDYINQKQRRQAEFERSKKEKRMKLLGLPCLVTKKTRIEDPCQDSDETESDLDWVPEPESDYLSINEVADEEREYVRVPGGKTAFRSRVRGVLPEPKRQRVGSERMTGGSDVVTQRMCYGNYERIVSHKNTSSVQMPNQPYTEYARMEGGEDKIPIKMRGNMPAPIYREKTLMLHPRRRRDYENERIPSQVFHEAVVSKQTPIVEKLLDDRLDYANVRRQKRPYTDFLDGRHHHDHWCPTQTKDVHVHYKAKLVEAKTTDTKTAANDKTPVQNFVMANPPCKKNADKDLSRPDYDFQKMIKEHLDTIRTDVMAGESEKKKDVCVPFDVVYHSRDPEELANLDYPGHQEFVEYLRAAKELLYEAKVEEGEERLFVDKEKLVNELEEDLKSIEGCLTSLSSSECTNLSNDSGSFLVIEGHTKLPLEYIRKPLVPFHELERSGFNAQVIDVDAEDRNPFRMMPYSGQLKAQLELIAAKDSFFTFNSRLRNGLRLRLEVPVPDVRKMLIGRGAHKYYGAVITDIDENYIDELKTRAPVKTFNFKTGIELIKDAMRLKFESLLIQGQIVRTKIYDRLNEQHWENMKQTKALYEKLFAKWEKIEYEGAMSVVYQVKQYYETTDALKREYRELERELMMLNMDIVFIEGHWIRCIMLQNFHYLLGDYEWRAEHDWIHKVPKIVKRSSEEGGSEEACEEENSEEVEYELESYDQSIAKRGIVNIRERDKDDAWAIRAFYYDVYMKNVHPILQVFPDAESFLQGIENLKNKTFVLLLEMHFTLAIHTELQGRLETFKDWCAKDLKEKEEYVARKSEKKVFMEARAKEMEERTLAFLDKPIEETFNDANYNRQRAVIAEVWRRVVPANLRGSGDVLPKSSDMVAMISDTVLEILTKFEFMDIEKVRETEVRLRKRRRYLEKLSAQAYQVEKRIEMEMKKVRRNLEPPYKAPKRTEKLQRLSIKKRQKKEVVAEKLVTENTKHYVRAFHQEDEKVEHVEENELMMVADTMQEQIVPFYFDHFLKLNGYTPNYNFKTQIELRDGPEINRFRVREVVPDVIEKVAHWEHTKRKIMEENIQRNPKMYENVN